MYLLLLVLLAFASSARASEFYLLQPREIYIDLYENQYVHDSFIAPDDEKLTHGANFGVNFSLAEWRKTVLYSDNILHFDQENTGKIRHVGWQYSLNLRAWSWGTSAIEVFQQHHSRHVVDETRPVRFPAYTRNGIKFVIFDRELK